MMMKQRRIGKLVICDALNLIDESKKFNNATNENQIVQGLTQLFTFPTSVTFRPPKRGISIQSDQLSISPKRRSELKETLTG